MRSLIIVLGLLVAAPAHAQDAPAPPTNDDCLACHGDASAVGADGSSVAVDAARFAASVHGELGLDCTACHTDLATLVELPHAEKLARVDCSSCHEAAVAAFQTSIHAQAAASGQRTDAATCVSCHTSHEIRRIKDPESPTYHFNLPKTCGTCHGETAVAHHMPGGDIFGQYHDSIHGRALDRGGLLVAPSCISCHGAHDIKANTDPRSRVVRANVPTTCGSCHEGVKRDYEQSVHGEQVAKGNFKAPVCIDCHTAHGILRAETAAWRVEVINECGTCHAESLHTYRDTFHGQVTELGFSRVAACADCHGAHEQHPKADPRSLVSDAQRVQTCGRCHEGANVNFAMYDPHADAHDHDRSPLLYYSARFMQLLLGGVFAFFSIHTGLWFTKSLRLVRQQRAAARLPPARPPGEASPGPVGGGERA